MKIQLTRTFLIFHFIFNIDYWILNICFLCVLCAYVVNFLLDRPPGMFLLPFHHQPVIGHPVVELLNNGLLKLEILGKIHRAHQVGL